MVRAHVDSLFVATNTGSVNGVPKALSLVTEEDHELMTPEEYTAYFEALEEHS